MQLSGLYQDFVLHFGEMSTRWGINRTVGQIFALLFISPTPLNAEEITTAIGVSRSNVSMGMKELQSWNLIHLQHRPGDRRDYFKTDDDLWGIMRVLAEERKKREIDPTLEKLRALNEQAPRDLNDEHALARIAETVDLLDLLTNWYDDINTLETKRLIKLMALGSKIGSFAAKPAKNSPEKLRKKKKKPVK